MFYVLKSVYLQSPDVVEQTRPAHLEFLKEEVDAGRLLLAGRQEDGSGGMLITADISADDVADMIERDPYTRAGRPLRSIPLQRRVPRNRSIDDRAIGLRSHRIREDAALVGGCAIRPQCRGEFVCLRFEK